MPFYMWSARVLLKRDGNTLVLQKRKTDRYEIISLVEYRHRLNTSLHDLLRGTAVFAFVFLLPHLTVSLAA